MAKYRTKDEIDLTWNRTRRQLTRDLDTRIQNFREELLNKILSAAWEKYAAELESGNVIQLEDTMTAWVDDVLHKQINPALEADHGDVDAD
jgi:hypothetical protein